MSACQQHKETLMLDIFGELNQDLMADWERHLKSCPDCRAEKEAIARAIGIAKSAFDAPPLGEAEAAAMRERVVRNLTIAPEKPRERKQPFFFSRAFFPALVSACVLLVVLGFTASKFLFGPKIDTGTQLAVSQESLPADDLDIINNMDLLRDLDALDKLAKVIDDSQPSTLPNNAQGKNGYGKRTIFS